MELGPGDTLSSRANELSIVESHLRIVRAITIRSDPVRQPVPAWREWMAATETERSRTGKSQTIERAGLILACFSAETPHLDPGRPGHPARPPPEHGLPLRRLAGGAGLLERDPRRGGYRIGLRVIELSNIALNQIEVRKHALDEMDRLRDELERSWSASGSCFEGDVLHIAHSVPSAWPRWYTTVGRRAVAHCTSLGQGPACGPAVAGGRGARRALRLAPIHAELDSPISRAWKRSWPPSASAATPSMSRSATRRRSASARPSATSPGPSWPPSASAGATRE